MNTVSKMRPFQLHRDEDESGVSGTGIVAEGVEFSSGAVALTWLSQFGAVNVYNNMRVVEELHGHGGKTRIVYLKDTSNEVKKGRLDELSQLSIKVGEIFWFLGVHRRRIKAISDGTVVVETWKGLGDAYSEPDQYHSVESFVRMVNSGNYKRWPHPSTPRAF